MNKLILLLVLISTGASSGIIKGKPTQLSIAYCKAFIWNYEIKRLKGAITGQQWLTKTKSCRLSIKLYNLNHDGVMRESIYDVDFNGRS